MAEQDMLQAALDELRRIDHKVTELLRVESISGQRIVVAEGLSDIDGNLGLIASGEFRAGNGIQPGLGFTGVRIGYPEFTYGDTGWHIVGVNSDTLQFGLRASDGVAVFGAGAVTLGATGIFIQTGQAQANHVTWRDVAGDDPTNYGALHTRKIGTTNAYGVSVIQAGSKVGAVSTSPSISLRAFAKDSAGNAATGQYTFFNNNLSVAFASDTHMNTSANHGIVMARESPTYAEILDGYGMGSEWWLLDDGDNLHEIWDRFVEWKDVSANIAEIRYRAGGAVNYWHVYHDLDTSTVDIVMNDDGGDVNYRMEGASDPNLLVTDAGLDAIGIGGVAVSGTKLTVYGALDAQNNLITSVADAVNPKDAVNLDTLLDHIGIILNYWLQADDVMDTETPGGTNSSTELVDSTPLTLATIFFKSSVVDTPAPFTLKAGSIMSLHINAEVDATSGHKPCTLMSQLFYVDADGTSNPVQIGTNSDETSALTTDKTEYDLHMHVSSDVTVPAGKRLWVKFIATTTGAQNDPTVQIYFGTSLEHLTFGVAGDVLSRLGGGEVANCLINGGFDFAQRQTPGTLTAVAADKYGADRWRSSVENASLQYNRNDATGETGLTCKNYGLFKKITNNGKFHVCQIVEGVNSVPLRSKTVIFQVQMKASASKTIRMAVLELATAGTIDAVPATLITAWGANETDPTLGANVAVITGAEEKSVTTSWATYSVSVTVPADSKNVICAIWSDADFTANDTLSVAEAGLYVASSGQAWKPRPIAQEIDLCQRYYEKTYPIDIVPGTNNTATIYESFCAASSAIECGQWVWMYKVRKRPTSPTITYYTPDGDLGKLSYYQYSGPVGPGEGNATTHRTSDYHHSAYAVAAGLTAAALVLMSGHSCVECEL